MLLYSRISSTIVMGKLKSKLKQKKSLISTWETKAGKFTISKKANINLCLSEFSVNKIMPWKCPIDNSTNKRYGMILGKDLLTVMGLDLKSSGKNVIVGEGLYE